MNDDEVKAMQTILLRSRSGGRLAAARAALDAAFQETEAIKERLTAARLARPQAELLEGVRLPEMPKPSRATREAYEGIMREAELHEPLERLAKEIDRQLERLLTERYPGTPIEAFVSSFIPGGLRITAPDGAAFDFVYTTHGPSTVDGATTMTMDLTVTEIKTGGEQE